MFNTTLKIEVLLNTTRARAVRSTGAAISWTGVCQSLQNNLTKISENLSAPPILAKEHGKHRARILRREASTLRARASARARGCPEQHADCIMPCGYCGGPGKNCRTCDCADARMYQQLNKKDGAKAWTRAMLLEECRRLAIAAPVPERGDSTSSGNVPLTARPTGAGATPGAPATGAPTASPHLPTHSDAPVPALAAALNVGDRVIVRAPLESSCKYEGRVAFVYSLHRTKCRLLLDDHPPRPDDPIRGFITGMVSQTVCVTIKKAVPQPEPGRWRLENAYLVARLSPVTSEWQIGMRVKVSRGKYAGQTGSILSVHPQSVTLRMDATGQVTGNLPKGELHAQVPNPRTRAQIDAQIIDLVNADLTVQFASAAA